VGLNCSTYFAIPLPPDFGGVGMKNVAAPDPRQCF